MNTQIIYPSEKYFKSFHEALSTVAKERVYIEMIEAPPLEKVSSFQTDLISKNGPVYYAINDDRVVGWCDVFPEKNPRQNHRGGLGMGLLPEFRGQGLGSKLLSSVLDHAKKFGLEKVELNVYTSNTPQSPALSRDLRRLRSDHRSENWKDPRRIATAKRPKTSRRMAQTACFRIECRLASRLCNENAQANQRIGVVQ